MSRRERYPSENSSINGENISAFASAYNLAGFSSRVRHDNILLRPPETYKAFFPDCPATISERRVIYDRRFAGPAGGWRVQACAAVLRSHGGVS